MSLNSSDFFPDAFKESSQTRETSDYMKFKNAKNICIDIETQMDLLKKEIELSGGSIDIHNKNKRVGVNNIILSIESYIKELHTELFRIKGSISDPNLTYLLHIDDDYSAYLWLTVGNVDINKYRTLGWSDRDKLVHNLERMYAIKFDIVETQERNRDLRAQSRFAIIPVGNMDEKLKQLKDVEHEVTTLLENGEDSVKTPSPKNEKDQNNRSLLAKTG